MQQDEKLKDQMFPMDFVKKDSVIKLEIAEPFYNRLKDLMINLTTNFSQDEIKDLTERIKVRNENPKDFSYLNEKEYHLDTLLVLIPYIEEQARKQDLVEVRQLTAKEVTDIFTVNSNLQNLQD